MQRLQLQIDKAVQKVDTLTRKYDELKNKKVPTNSYTALQNKITAAKSELSALIAEEEKFVSIGSTTGTAWDALIQKEADAQLKIEDLNAKMQKLVDTGKAFTVGADPAEINNAANDLSRAKSELRMLVTKQDELQTKNTKVSHGLSGIAERLKKIGMIGTRAFSGMNRHVKKSGGLLSSFTSRLKSMALSLLVFNWITKGFHAMVSGMKDGFKNLVQYSDEYNRSVSSLQSANLQLKNSFAAAFAPIVQMVIPYLVQLIGYVTSAVNAFAQFIAIMGGKTIWTRETKVQQNYAASLNGTAAAAKKAVGALASFDEIEVLSKKDSDSGSGTATIDPGSMFEEVPVGELNGFWKKLRDALKNGKWYELGKYIGEQLKEALDNIPWNQIKAKAREVGKNLAKLINGFIEVDDLGYSIGKTLAEAFNTGFEFLDGFVRELHWESLGEFIADELNGVLENLDWDLIGDTFVTGAKGLADCINSFDKNFRWDNISDTISNGLNTLSETVITFFETADWADIGKNLGDQLIKSIKKTNWESVGRAIGDLIHSAIVFTAGALSEWDWEVISDAIKDLVKGFFSAFDDDDLPENIKKYADAIEIFGLAIGGILLLNGMAGLVANVRDFFGLFAGGKTAMEIGDVVTEIGGMATASETAADAAGGLSELFSRLCTVIGVFAGCLLVLEGGYDLLTRCFLHLQEEMGKNADQLDAVAERYGGEIFTSAIHGASDALGGLGASFEGLPNVMSGSIWAFEALDQMMANISEGLIYSDDQLKKAQETWKLSADDVEMLRQSMLDANEATFSWSDAYPELDNASAQTLANITEGMRLVNEGVVQNEVDLAALAEQSGYTSEAFTFLDEYMTDSLSPTIEANTENVVDNTVALQDEQIELSNTDDSLEIHQQVLENTNEKLQSTQTEMSKTKDASKDMATGVNTSSDDIKNTTNIVWPLVSQKMKSEMQSAKERICELLTSIMSDINSVLEGIGAIAKAGAGVGASIGSAAIASVQSVQTQSYAQEIPHLATGAVIRGGNPFMAVLGDQKFGQTNVEAPLSTIKDAVRDVMSENSYSGSGGDVTINLNYDGETFARLFLPDFLSEAHRQGYDIDFDPA